MQMQLLSVHHLFNQAFVADVISTNSNTNYDCVTNSIMMASAKIKAMFKVN